MNLFIFWLLMGWSCSRLAARKGRRPLLWFVLGVTLGIFVLITLLFLPSNRSNKAEKRRVKGGEDKISAAPHLLWYYLDEEKNQRGPMSLDALKREWIEDKVTGKTYLWNETMKEWERAENFISTLSSHSQN